MSVRTIGGNLLFWKISAAFAALLFVLGIVFYLLASTLSTSYYNAAHQQLFGNVAEHLATFTKPFKEGKPDTTVTHDILHSTMVANPTVEIYLLDTSGRILDYVVPEPTVRMSRVNMATVREWLASDAGKKPMGDNPKAPGDPGLFSVAPVQENGRTTGYVYAVLASETQKRVVSALTNNLNTRLAYYIFSAALLGAFVVGMITFFLITDSVCSIAGVVRQFKEGDYSARIQGYAKGNLGVLTTTFNEMADVIVGNFEKITATDRLRQELIANVSHDLRTPLSIMQGYLDTLAIKKDTLSEAEKDRYFSVIHESVSRLSGLVEQLFQYAKLEANVVTLQREKFPLHDLVSDILSAYQLKAADRNITLELQAAKPLPLIHADIALIERVFQNLLDNAFKFTPEGGQITVFLSPAEGGIRAVVSDTGAGIPKEFQQQIFERYKQVKPYSASEKGAGLGLAIIRKILELHQSDIAVVSDGKNGSAFEFVLRE